MGNLTLYNVLDYQSILEYLENIFENFLLAQHASAVTRKNYRSDLRYFINWLIKTVKNSNPESQITQKSLLQNITIEAIQQYKQSLEQQLVPTATINRRLSTIRRFLTGAITNGLIQNNPALLVRNVPTPLAQDNQTLLLQFENYLHEEGASKITVKNYVNDVNEFLNWISS